MFENVVDHLAWSCKMAKRFGIIGVSSRQIKWSLYIIREDAWTCPSGVELVFDYPDYLSIILLCDFVIELNGSRQLAKCMLTNGWVLLRPRREKTCLRVFANNTGADQPAHPRSLISALVISVLKSTICKLATGEISII